MAGSGGESRRMPMWPSTRRDEGARNRAWTNRYSVATRTRGHGTQWSPGHGLRRRCAAAEGAARRKERRKRERRLGAADRGSGTVMATGIDERGGESGVTARELVGGSATETTARGGKEKPTAELGARGGETKEVRRTHRRTEAWARTHAEAAWLRDGAAGEKGERARGWGGETMAWSRTRRRSQAGSRPGDVAANSAPRRHDGGTGAAGRWLHSKELEARGRNGERA